MHMVCAVLSWYLVERPALALKRYLGGEAGRDQMRPQATELDAVRL
jgi:hypothetical protein